MPKTKSPLLYLLAIATAVSSGCPGKPSPGGGGARGTDSPAPKESNSTPAEDNKAPVAAVGGDDASTAAVDPVNSFTIAQRDAFVAKMKALKCNVEQNEQGDVISLIMGFTKVSDDDLADLDKLPKLEYIALDNTNVTDAGLKHLADLKSLKILYLGSNSLTAAGIKHLSGLRGLQFLDLSDLPIGDDALPSLAGMKKLEKLNLYDTNVTLEGTFGFAKALPDLEVTAPFGRLIGGRRLTMSPGVEDADLARLKKLPTLRELDLWECDQITDAGLEHVKTLEQLTALELGFTKVTDDGLGELQAMKNLAKLDVRETNTTLAAALKLVAKVPKLHVLADWGTTEGAQKVSLQPTATDEQIKQLKNLPGITQLNLWRCDELSPSAMADVAKLGKLQEINLGATNIGDDGLAALGDLSQLERLVLANAPLTDAGLATIAKHGGLLDLDLGSTAITDAGLKQLAALKNLKHLSLAGTAVTDDGIKQLAALKQLESLDLSETRITGEGLAALKELPKLRKLDLSLTLVGDEALATVSAMPAIEQLELWGTPITDADLEHLHDAKQLKQVGVFGTAVSEEAVAAFRREVPGADLLRTIEENPSP